MREHNGLKYGRMKNESGDDEQQSGTVLNFVKVMLSGQPVRQAPDDLGLRIDGDVKIIAVQLPMADCEFVLHVDMYNTGVVSVRLRKKRYDGWWSGHLCDLDTKELIRLEQLSGEKI